MIQLADYANKAYEALTIEQQVALMSLYKTGAIAMYISDEDAKRLQSAGLITEAGELTQRGSIFMSIVTGKVQA
jgi:hypothetical protein